MNPWPVRRSWAIDVMAAALDAPDDPDLENGYILWAMSRAEEYLKQPNGAARLLEAFISLTALLLFRAGQKAPGSNVTTEEMRAILQQCGD